MRRDVIEVDVIAVLNRRELLADDALTKVAEVAVFAALYASVGPASVVFV